MRKAFISFLFFLLFCSSSIATVNMELDHTQIKIGETIKLIITLEGSNLNSTPNLTPLQADFSIVGTERSMNYTVINGQAHSVSQWVIFLLPKKTGHLTIPPLQIGQEKTPAQNVQVKEEEAKVQKINRNSNSNDIMLRMEANENTSYVNQQLILTVTLYNRLDLMNVDYKPPEVKDALLISLGEGRRYQTTEQGKIYTAEEQKYALFPAKSGSLRIKPPSLQALAYDAAMLPLQINKQAKPLTIQVHPIPPQYQDKPWFPAKQITLEEHYDQTKSFEQGSTLVRTITLQVSGIPAQLIPSFEFTNPRDNAFHVYPEKISEKNIFSQNDILGTVKLRLTYLLNKTGQITLPAFVITWFNTNTGKEEHTKLASRIIEVMPSSPTPSLRKEKNEPYQAQENQAVSNLALSSNRNGWWLAAILAVAWLITLALWYRQKAKKQSTRKTSKQIMQQLREACLENNSVESRKALIKWAQWRWPQEDILSLLPIARKTNDKALSQEIYHLSEILYQQRPSKTWDRGKILWTSVLTYEEKHVTPSKRKDDFLPSLYKL